MDANARFGKAETWCTLLSTSALTSLAQSGDSHVYTTDGLDAIHWFPYASDLGDEISSMEYDKLTSAGVDVRICRELSKEHRVTCLQMAASGISPAILSSIKRSATSDHQDITVTQRAVFDLRDLLGDVVASYHDQIAQGEVRAASLFEVTAAVARKVRQLAHLKVLRLDSSAKDVVFVAKLEERENGRLESVGYQTTASDVFGVPMLTLGTGELTVSMKDDTGDYTQARYGTMMTLLLASVAAEFGPAASSVMLHRLTGRDPSGKPIAPDELPEDHATLNIFKAAEAIDEVYLADLSKRVTEAINQSNQPNQAALQRNLAELVVNLRSLKTPDSFEQPFATGWVAHSLHSSNADTRISGRQQPAFDEVAQLLKIG